jgi:hypothetical protein
LWKEQEEGVHDSRELFNHEHFECLALDHCLVSFQKCNFSSLSEFAEQWQEAAVAAKNSYTNGDCRCSLLDAFVGLLHRCRRMDRCHGRRLCASLLRQIDNSFYTCCLLRFSQISQTKELLPSTYPSELLACLLSSFLPSYISITFSSCFHDTTTFVQVWSS